MDGETCEEDDLSTYEDSFEFKRSSRRAVYISDYSLIEDACQVQADS